MKDEEAVSDSFCRFNDGGRDKKYTFPGGDVLDLLIGDSQVFVLLGDRHLLTSETEFGVIEVCAASVKAVDACTGIETHFHSEAHPFG